MALGPAASCGDDGDGRPSAESEPRDGDIRALLDDVWVAMGVDADAVRVGEYVYRFVPDAADCDDLPRDDRWLGERGSTASDPALAVDAAEQAVADHLARAGFEVARYESTNPSATERQVRGVRDETVVSVHTQPGYASVKVSAGPCAPGFGEVDPDLMQPVG